jgi:4-aminobutyrate aminotransferase/(S)-3-amino-2-methylpropionate transaminase
MMFSTKMNQVGLGKAISRSNLLKRYKLPQLQNRVSSILEFRSAVKPSTRQFSEYVHPQEYATTKVIGSIPGPKSTSEIRKMGRLQEEKTLHFAIDIGKCQGNMIVDVDGNVLLDTFCQISSIPLGYNHPAMLDVINSKATKLLFANRPALGVFVPKDWSNTLETTFGPVRPPELTHFMTLASGAEANETAFKCAFSWYMRRRRGDNKPLPEDEESVKSVLLNQPPGSSKLSIMSFQGGFHGRTLGALSTTRSNPNAKLDFPAFDWPAAPFPKLKYPLKDFESDNRKEEDRCLAEVERMIEEWRNKGSPVAGLIVEPIQGEGGDNHATPYFFKRLREITTNRGVAFIVDEVQTGCGATGKMFAHYHWGLSEQPDIVTFAKKFQSCGFFAKPDFRIPGPYRNFNTWLGDPSRVLQTRAILDEINKSELLELVNSSGARILEGLNLLASRYRMISKVRGQGTFCAFDCESVEMRDTFLKDMRNRGIECGGSGTKTVRMRPALIFASRHVDIFLTACEESLKSLHK